MNQLQIFNNERFGQVRTIEANGKVLFCGSDVAKALGYARPNDAINAHCRATVKHSTPISGKMQEVNFITEGDIYRLAAKSELPGAEEFESWIFDEILPSIRKHGMYAKDELLDNPDLMIEVITQLKKEREEKKLLQTENKLLSQETLTWTDRKVIEAIVKKVGSKIGYETAWKEFKKEVLYSHGIALNSRITNWRNVTGKKSGPRTLDMIVDDELPACLATATAAARHHGIDISDIINKFEKSA